ncbi:hypothetical protein [Flavobacterium branchiicola]|uniref:Uncharacterized protein n=1 Tax=Flavobacterium branchiicola TaxID=1114875 RepID=A0ABV9PB81_9FLAO|nr:hypothetical protein [Flavobacterium branchiicola]MBS7252852.1 hypothetical protein [Flavobacterium branchiicola]
MRTIIWSFSVFFCLMFSSFAQTKGIEKGTYLSTNKGQKIKLNLSEDNKYELVFYSGEYEIKGDSLLFTKKIKSENNFNLSFTTNKKAKKVKIKFIDPSYYTFYIGTQKGTEEVQYQNVSDIRTKVDPNWVNTDLEFDIEKTDFLYLVYEDYTGQSNVCKYALPKDVSQVTISYELEVLGDLNIAGFFDRKTNKLQISEHLGKNPLVFVNEKDSQSETTSGVLPLENKTISNWTYPGKAPLLNEDFGAAVAVDSAVAAVDYAVVDSSYSKYDFKLKIEKSLKSALEATKTAKTKFLVVAVDSKNKEGFDTFIKDQETQIGYNMYDAYNPLYDVFNFYLAGADDKKWLKNNKIKDDPSTFVVNASGDILAVAKSNIADKQYQFGYYSDFYRKLLRTDAFIAIDKTLKNKKATDADLIAAFNKASVLETTYDYDSDYTLSDPDTTEFIVTKSSLDKKEVTQAWKKLIEAHQKDTKPNMYLVEAILKEIQNQGFTKQIFNTDRILNDTDFLAIDYLLKHSEEIEKNRTAFNSKDGEIHGVGNVISEISSAMQQNLYANQDEVSGDINKDKVNSVYKKIIASGKGNFESYRNYFSNLDGAENKEGSYTDMLREFNIYFDANLASASPIEKLDSIFSTLDSNSDYSYNGWNSFKEYHSNICNSAAWTVVVKPENANFIKDAIKWSEYSLVVTKNNTYYLDTLAQLYYKDGQKEKAIATQTLAVKYLTPEVDEETANEMKETLSKMQNGTY